VLETGEVVRLGSNDPRKTEVRFVSATNKDLRKLIAQGDFREDLYFRINGASVHVPPLRERREDIPRIAQHAPARLADEMKQPTPEITDAALMRLTAYDWPGNVRQLLNVIQNMVVSAIGEAAGDAPPRLEPRHIPPEVRAGEDEGEAGAASGTLAGTSLE